MFNFRKISAILTGAVMIGSTAGFAAAANFPSGFTSSTPAIVYGASAPPSSDLTAANSISSYLANKVPTTGGAPTSGDFLKFEKSNDMLNINEELTDFYSSAIDGDTQSGALGTLLASGVYSNADNDDYDYDQDLTLRSGLALEHFQDDDFSDVPVIGIPISDGDYIFSYKVEFTDVVDTGTSWADLENTDITLMGKDFFISEVANTTNGLQITLLDAANTAIVVEGEPTTLVVEGVTYDVSISHVEDGATRLNINGEVTSSIDEGETVKLDNGAYVGVKTVDYNAKDSGISQVEFSIGTGKIVLEHTEEVQVNEDPISDIEDSNEYSYTVNASITNSGTTLTQIDLSVYADSDMWLAPGSKIKLPGFDSIELSMTGFVFPAEEVTKVEPSGDDKIKLSTSLYDGDVNFELVYTNDTNIIGIGKDSDENLLTTNNTFINFDTNDKYFVATWINGDDAESYLLELSDPDDSATGASAGKYNDTVIKSIGSGKEVTLQLGEDAEDIGSISFDLSVASETAKTGTIVVTPSGSGTVYLDRLVTKEGLTIFLPVDAAGVGNAYTGFGAINLTSATSHTLVFDEEDEDNTIGSGPSFTANLALASSETTVNSIGTGNLSGGNTFETEDDSEDFVGYVNSSLATKVLSKTGGDQDPLELTYHGEEAYAEVYISEVGTSSDGEAGNMVYMDSEDDWKSMNAILVGGSCVNSATAEALDVASGTCGSDWVAKTSVGENKYLIQVIADKFSDGKIALIAAGYSADDTKAAADRLVNEPETVDTTAGNKYVYSIGAEGADVCLSGC